MTKIFKRFLSGKRTRIGLFCGIFLIGIGVRSEIGVWGQANLPRSRSGAPSVATKNRNAVPNAPGRNLPLPSRNNIPTPSALPSQQLASQAPKSGQTPQRTSCLLRSNRRVGSTDIIEIGLEGSGEIRQTLLGNEKNPSEKKPDQNMEVVAGFRYEERILDYGQKDNRRFYRSLRQYDQAGMKRNFQGTVTRPLLDISRKNVITQYDDKALIQYSPAGPLKNDQFLLINELPANSLLLDELLPNREVKLGEEWTIPDEILAPFLGLDTVEENTVRLVLTAIIDDMAEVDLFLTEDQKNDKGEPLPSSIQGASLGASVTMDLRGKYQFDLKSQRMTWFGLTVTENRSESLVEPGLDWSGTIRIRIAPMESPDELTDEKVKELNVTPDDENLLLVYNGQKGPWNFRHRRNWRMIEDGETSAALTLVEKGEGIAQCNILSNGKIDLATMPTLDSYKEELKKGLGDQFGQFVDASEYDDPRGYHILAVMVDGQYEDLPFRRTYYLLTDKSGYQSTVMFDVRADSLELFGRSGQEIIDSFMMIVPSEEERSDETKGDGKTSTPTENTETDSAPAGDKTAETTTDSAPIPSDEGTAVGNNANKEG